MASSSINLTISSEVIPPKDERDAAIKSLESKCRDICNLAHDVRNAERELHAAEDGRASTSEIVKAAMKFGALSERIYSLKDEIERDLRHYNVDCEYQICVSHTAEGLPIRVNSTRKVSLWG